jgi:hypothetical protein
MDVIDIDGLKTMTFAPKSGPASADPAPQEGEVVQLGGQSLLMEDGPGAPSDAASWSPAEGPASKGVEEAPPGDAAAPPAASPDEVEGRPPAELEQPNAKAIVSTSAVPTQDVERIMPLMYPRASLEGRFFRAILPSPSRVRRLNLGAS